LRKKIGAALAPPPSAPPAPGPGEETAVSVDPELSKTPSVSKSAAPGKKKAA
jgi:hypothetical protein